VYIHGGSEDESGRDRESERGGITYRLGSREEIVRAGYQAGVGGVVGGEQKVALRPGRERERSVRGRRYLRLRLREEEDISLSQTTLKAYLFLDVNYLIKTHLIYTLPLVFRQKI